MAIPSAFLPLGRLIQREVSVPEKSGTLIAGSFFVCPRKGTLCVPAKARISSISGSSGSEESGFLNKKRWHDGWNWFLCARFRQEFPPERILAFRSCGVYAAKLSGALRPESGVSPTPSCLPHRLLSPARAMRNSSEMPLGAVSAPKGTCTRLGSSRLSRRAIH